MIRSTENTDPPTFVWQAIEKTQISGCELGGDAAMCITLTSGGLYRGLDLYCALLPRIIP